MTDDLHIWTLYDGPRDFPSLFVARRFVINGNGAVPTKDVLTSPRLAALRTQMIAKGLTCIHRSPRDEPQIIESWI